MASNTDPSRPDALDLHIAKYADWRERYADLFADMLRGFSEPWVEEDEVSAMIPDQGMCPEYGELKLFAAFFNMNVVRHEGAEPEIKLILNPKAQSMTPSQFRTALASALRGVADLVDGKA